MPRATPLSSSELLGPVRGATARRPVHETRSPPRLESPRMRSAGETWSDCSHEQVPADSGARRASAIGTQERRRLRTGSSAPRRTLRPIADGTSQLAVGGFVARKQKRYNARRRGAKGRRRRKHEREEGMNETAVARRHRRPDYSRVLFVRPSWAEGAGRVLDLAGTLSWHNESQIGQKSDYYAILSDWCAVGADMRMAMSDFAEERKAQTR